MRVLAGWAWHESKAYPWLPNTSQYKVLLYLLPFGRNSDVKLLTPQFDLTPHLEGGVDLGDRRWYQSKSRFHILIWLLYTLTPFGHSTQRGKQTDRAIGKGRLCYSIGGPKAMSSAVHGSGQKIIRLSERDGNLFHSTAVATARASADPCRRWRTLATSRRLSAM